MSNGKKKVPVKEGMFSFKEGKASLIGNSCVNCGEIFFPRKENSFCPHCQHEILQDLNLSNEGEITTFTVVHQPPAGGFYKGPVPFAYGIVRLPEGVYVETLFTGIELDEIKTGLRVQLVIDKLFDEDDGTEIISYKFAPVT